MKIQIPWQSVEEFNDWQLEEVGANFKEIQKRPHQMSSFPIKYKKYEATGFRTPSGKIEIYSGFLEKMGYDPLPPFVEPPQSPVTTPDLFLAFPLIMVTHRNIIYMHSEFRQLPSFRKVEPSPFIEINPETAGKEGIQDGEVMWVERPGFQERIRGKARYVPELDPRVISVHVGWWFPEKPGPVGGFDGYVAIRYRKIYQGRKLVRKDKPDIVEDNIYLGELPIMIGGGEFIINGADRVIVSLSTRRPASTS